MRQNRGNTDGPFRDFCTINRSLLSAKLDPYS